jgi:beta-phosphoglucomutase-like phosphatase (HAD superfamily)
MSDMKKTLFLDIDGCLIKHNGNLTKQIESDVEVLPGVIEKLNEWEAEGCKIILTTGRKESMRGLTERQLQSVGIFYDQLVMGINRGQRIVINDKKPNNDMSVARAIEIPRNVGLKKIEI